MHGATGLAIDSTIPAIRERLCEFLKRQQPTVDATALAFQLQVDELELRLFLEGRSSSVIDPRFLIELLVAVVHRFGVDCSYLLTGEYSFAEHCHVEDELLSRENIHAHVRRRLSGFSQETTLGYV